MKIALTPVAELSFNEKESILYIKMLEGAVLNLKDTIIHAKQIEEITANKPYLALVDSTKFFTMDKETLPYASSRSSRPAGRIAMACFNPNLANRCSVEMCRKLGKPVY